jgi:hypothetical protein
MKDTNFILNIMAPPAKRLADFIANRAFPTGGFVKDLKPRDNEIAIPVGKTMISKQQAMDQVRKYLQGSPNAPKTHSRRLNRVKNALKEFGVDRVTELSPEKMFALTFAIRFHGMNRTCFRELTAPSREGSNVTRRVQDERPVDRVLKTDFAKRIPEKGSTTHSDFVNSVLLGLTLPTNYAEMAAEMRQAADALEHGQLWVAHSAIFEDNKAVISVCRATEYPAAFKTVFEEIYSKAFNFIEFPQFIGTYAQAVTHFEQRFSENTTVTFSHIAAKPD